MVDDKPTSVFVTYIAATPDRLWQALTDGDVTRQYFFGRRMASDWQVGSLLALKDNHPKLSEAVSDEFTATLEADVPPRDMRRHVTVETNRGRQERREYFALPAPRHLPGFAD
jgi:hypothetical protein